MQGLHLGVAPTELIACGLTREIRCSVLTVLEIVVFFVQRIVGLIERPQRAAALEIHGPRDSIWNLHRATPHFMTIWVPLSRPLMTARCQEAFPYPITAGMRLTI